MLENYKFDLLEEFYGYSSTRDKTTIDPHFLIRGSKNVYFKRSGTVVSRPGLKLRGSVDSTDAGVKSSYEWTTSKGFTRPLRVANNKLQVESDIVNSGDYVWYDLSEVTTALNPARSLTSFVYDAWWSERIQKDNLVMCRGDNFLLSWAGGMAVVASHSTSTNAINGPTLSSGGSSYVVGDRITVDGGTTSAILEVTSVSGGAINGFGVINPGAGYSVASGVATTGGSGSGATVDISAVADVVVIIKEGTESWEEVGFDYLDVISGVSSRFAIVGGASKGYSIDGTSMFILGSATVSVGDVITSAVKTHANEPIEDFECDFLRTINNQVLVGSYSSRVTYISADIDFTDFENAGSYVPGDPDQVIMDNLGKGIGVQDGQAIIFAGNSDLYVVTLNDPVPVSFTNPSESGARFIITKVQKKFLSGLGAAISHDFIGNFDGELVWLDQNNQLRAQGTFANVDAIKPTLLSLPVREEFSEEDFTGGHLAVVNDTMHITAPINGRDWMYQVRQLIDDSGNVNAQRIWHPPQIRNISRFALIDGVVYGHSNSNPQIYQVWDTLQWTDDSPSGEDLPYECRMTMAYRSHGDRFMLKNFDKIAVEGYISEGTLLNAYVYFDYQGATDLQNITINSIEKPVRLFSGTSPFSLGDSPLGENPLGDGIVTEANEQDLLPKFRAIRGVGLKNCFEYSIEIYSTDPSSRWEILSLGTNISTANEKPVFLGESN